MPYDSASHYWRARKARQAARAWARARVSLPDQPPACPACRRTLARVGDTFYCLAPVTGPGSCPRAYTD
jgi:hypothetical protein